MSSSWSFPAYLRVLLAIGLYLQLAGICFIADGSRYATITNLTLFLPALAALVLFRHCLPQFNRAAFGLLMALCMWVAIVALFNEGSIGEPWRWLRLILYVGLYVVAIAFVMQNKNLWRGLLVAVVCTAAVFAWLSLFQAIFIDQRGLGFRDFRLDSWSGYDMADFDNPIVAALYFGVIAIVAISLSVREKGAISLVSQIAFLGTFLYCYFTYSRGVWVALLAAIMVYLAVSLDVRRFRLVLWGFALFSIVGLLLLGRVGGIDASYRDEIFWVWWSKVDTFWLWGAGAGADPNICIEEVRRCFNQAHSLYLQFFYEYGIFGVLLLLALIGGSMRNGWRHRGEYEFAPLGLSLMAFVLVASVANFYVIFLRPSVFWIIFWLPVAILVYEKAEWRRSESL
ncbi:O-antigen ligase family protein [Pseudomonas sp. NPDC077408]